MQTSTDTNAVATGDVFSIDPTGLSECASPELVDVEASETYELRIAPVAKQLGGDHVRMLSYNGSIPGPTLRVREGSEFFVHVTNDGDTETTVHWHGLRLDNASDGVPFETQPPIPVGGDFTYRVRVPDAGLYWYHPHMREDYGLEMGLYGNIVVVPSDDEYWAPVNRELVVTLDDVLVEDGHIATFSQAGPTHVAMGRFGNVMLTGGRTAFDFVAQRGEVVRFYFTNTANSRLFNVSLPGARMKLVGGDSGRYEHEAFVEDVLLAPSERAVVDIFFDTAGTFALEHRTPMSSYVLGTVVVGDDRVEQSCAEAFMTRRTFAELAGERGRVAVHRDREPDKTIEFKSEMPHMHDDVDPATAAPGHAEHTGHMEHTPDGIEWEDLMPELNATTDSHNMIWKLVDGETGHVNGDIDWAFTVGDQVKIRLVNDMAQDHLMHHPFHVHGAGRFLVLARNGVTDTNLVWKDTVLVRANETVDILLDVTNAGVWMAHCHIAEHNQSGMMFSFSVAEGA